MDNDAVNALAEVGRAVLNDPTVTEVNLGEAAPPAAEQAPPVAPVVANDVEHACRQPGFNAMVDTCPQCPRKSAATVLRDAEERPFRFTRASRWIVQGLLQHHYLPYWPRASSDVFATIDVQRSMVVAACVYAMPVLRCGLREDVFGVLSPESLNRDFRQLVRWMVHPDYRVRGVGTELLAWSITQMRTPVVEAINRSWVPVAAFLGAGMVHRHDAERHYYYRLRDIRTRDDEGAHPPEQTYVGPEPFSGRYPRIWEAVPKINGNCLAS